ncbi:LuxR family transcriptional regulator [Aquabacterium sp. A7-Y]|uniref:helix-turn-helix transcriptional regulator n=1 Tax=Aquabacterium sp. A7-Y TaxID=1349605 RepID=UPI00223E56F8|nr:LuxR family transcriptional regulator [Aquabacterium sp. A7-Y]MCW7537835.1 LuxR family transcriptional regulator [Aquabacterium sp. A7-Y]
MELTAGEERRRATASGPQSRHVGAGSPGSEARGLLDAHGVPLTPDDSPPGVLLYTEADLVLLEQEQRQPQEQRRVGLPSLVGDLLELGSAADRERRVRAMLHATGFEWFAYGTVSTQRGRGQPQSFFSTYSNPVWTPHYFRERYYELDPRHQDAPRSSLPLVWDLDDIIANSRGKQAPPRTRRFLSDFCDSGIASGVFFRVASPYSPNERTVISLMSSVRHRGWIDDGVLGQALTFGLSMHEFLSRHASGSSDPVTSLPWPALSPLQREILECLIGGKSDKQIADRLKLSAHTVDYHLRQLRRRFSARNRVQLVNAAIDATMGHSFHDTLGALR